MINTLYATLRDTWIITLRNIRRYLRMPRLIFFSSVQPIMFLLLFNYVFGGAINPSINTPDGKYIDYLLPGIMIQMVMFGGVQTGIGLAEDMGKGIIDRFRSLPMSRAAVVSGRTLSDSIRNIFVIFIMLVVGFMLGFRFHGGIDGAIFLVVVSVLFGFALSWVFAFIGMVLNDPETAQLASFVFIFPMVFASAAFVPIATMPDWLQVFARNQPVTFATSSVRHFALGLPDDGSTWKLLFWIAILLAVFIPLSIWQYRRRVT